MPCPFITEAIAYLDKHQWLATLGTVFPTACLAVWQINRQFKNTLLSQRANKLDELHAEIYKEIANKIELCQSALSKTTNTAITIPSSFEGKIRLDKHARTLGFSESPHIILERHPQICAEHNDANQKMADILLVMDKYEIVFADFSNMRMHIRLSSVEFICASSDFHNYLLQFLPMDVTEEDRIKPGTKVMTQPLPDQEAHAHIRQLSEKVQELSFDLSAYLHDLRIESQNALLSPIFGGKKAPKRIPGDPNYRVLTINGSK